MIDVGVSDIAIYIPQFYLPHDELAEARGVPPEKFREGLGNHKMAILPNWEDSVTMAANAAAQLLEKTGTNPQEIHQLVVSTESGVDHSKPVASFVQGLLKIGSRFLQGLSRSRSRQDTDRHYGNTSCCQDI